MRRDGRWLGPIALVLLVAARGPDDRSDDEKTPARLDMTPAVACESIKGYQDYVPRPEATLTKDEKLLVYYEPLNYKIEHRKDGTYRAHFTQDARVRKRGSKAVLWKKDDLLDYEAKGKEPPHRLCLTNTIALKGLTPGEYDLDIILHDRLDDGPPATQTLKLRIKPSPPEEPPSSPTEPGDEPEPKGTP